MRASVAFGAVLLLATSAQAEPGERDRLNACKAMVARAAQPGAPASDEAQLQKCRQMIKEWTLRDSRRSVDEDGRPLK